MRSFHPPVRFPRLAIGALALLAAGCADRATAPTLAEPPAAPPGTLAVLTCHANVAGGTAECFAGSADGLATPGGVSAAASTIGGQGYYVRLAASNVASAGGTFSMDVTAQNLSNLAMGTADGATPHANGVRVFFHAGPTASPSGTVTLANPTGTAMFTAAEQPYIEYAGAELGADGLLSTAEVSSAKSWQFTVDGGAASFSFSVYVSTEVPPGEIATLAPQVTATSESTLAPGKALIIDGVNFAPDMAGNTVLIGGVPAAISFADRTVLLVTVPCIPSGTVGIQVVAGGMAGVPLARPLQVSQHTLEVGEAAIVTEWNDARCTELNPSGEDSRYVVAVYSTSGSPTAATSFELSAVGAGTAVPVASRAPADAVRAPGGPRPDAARTAREAAAQRIADQRHHELLEKNAAEFERLSRRFAGDARMRPRHNVLADLVEPPVNRTIRVADVSGSSICQNHYTVNATRVYYAGKLAIYEDDATPVNLKAANNPTMAAYYQAIGDQYNADMEPIVRENFADPIRRDAETDNNGVLIALFTPLVGNQFPGLAGFVVSCDQFPNDGTSNASSNFGEFFYAFMPTNADSGYGAGTPDSWYRIVRGTFIHETKHVASQASRVANGAPLEASWLEEGTARHAEELWARHFVYDVAWKGNTGYGSPADNNSIYCDIRPDVAACNAANSRRPSLSMWRHFSSTGVYWWMGNSRTSSPFGSSASDQSAGMHSAFYGSSWSLVRYTIDRYGASDAEFLSSLTEASTLGTVNLADRAGVPLARLLGGWALALYADDYPGLASPSADIDFPTWNSQSIFDGFLADVGPPEYPRARHLLPTATYSFGSLAPVSSSGLVGGGAVYYEFTGTHAATQLIRLTGAGGATLPSSIRIAVARLE